MTGKIGICSGRGQERASVDFTFSCNVAFREDNLLEHQILFSEAVPKVTDEKDLFIQSQCVRPSYNFPSLLDFEGSAFFLEKYYTIIE